MAEGGSEDILSAVDSMAEVFLHFDLREVRPLLQLESHLTRGSQKVSDSLIYSRNDYLNDSFYRCSIVVTCS